MPSVKLPEGEGGVKPDGRGAQVIGYLRTKLHRLPLRGMFEGETLCMQPQAASWNGLSVQRVGVDRISDGREVDPDLVGPPRLELHSEHRVARGLREHLEVGDGGPPYPCGHERRGVRVAPDRRVDRARLRQPFAN